MEAIRRHIPDMDRALLLALLIAVLAAWPFILHPSLPRETDAELHVFRTAEIGELIRDGVLYSRWAPDFYFGYGYPIFNFYAPATYYLANLLTLAVPGGAVLGVKLVFILGFLLGGIGMFSSVRHLMGDDRGAILAEVLFLFTPYVYLIDPHLRGVLPEFFAIMVAPAALASLIRYHKRRTRRDLLLASGSSALLLLSHNILGPSLFVFLLGFSIWDLVLVPFFQKSAISLKELLWDFLPLFSALLLAAFFLVPVIAESGEVRLANLVTADDHFDYHNHFVSLSFLLQPSKALDLTAANPRALQNLGFPQWFFALVGLIVTMLRLSQDEQLAWRVVFLGLVAVFLIFMITPTSVLVWESIEALAYIQFPWRLLGALAMVLPPIGATAISPLLKMTRLKRRIDYAILLAFALLAMLPIFRPPFWGGFGETDIAAIADFDRYGPAVGTTATGDYIPVGVETTVTVSDQLHDQVRAGGPVDRILYQDIPEDTSIALVDSGPTDHTYQVETTEPFTLVYQAFYFPGWRASLDGNPVEITTAKPEGFIQVYIPSGVHLLRIWFGSTPSRDLGNLLTLTGMLLVAITVSRLPVENKKHQPSNEDLDIAAITISVSFVIALVVGSLGLLQPIDNQVPLHMENLQQVSFDNGVDFFGFDLALVNPNPGEELTLRLYWRASEPVSSNYQTFVHLVTTPDRIWAEQVRLNPANYPMKRWPAGKFIIDEYKLTIPPGTPPGTYTLNIGLWQMSTGRRAAIFNTSGELLGDFLPLSQQILISDPTLAEDFPSLSFEKNEDFSLVEGLHVIGYNQDPDNPILQSSGTVTFDIHYLAALSPLPAGQIIFRMVDDRGEEIFLSNTAASADFAPVDSWVEGQIIRDLRSFRFDENSRRGLYRIDLAFLPEGQSEPGEFFTLGLIELAE